MHELVIYDGALSDTDLTDVCKALLKRWRMEALVPPSVRVIARPTYALVPPPKVANATVYLQWDASVTNTMSGPIQAQVDTWRPVVGPPGVYVVRFGPSSELQPKYVMSKDGRPGVDVLTGTVMSTVAASPQPLYGRAVFVVVTMHAQTTPSNRVVLGHRPFPENPPGSMLLRLETSGKMVTWLFNPNGGWRSFEYNTAVVMEQRQVWGLQYQFRKPSTIRQHVSSGGAGQAARVTMDMLGDIPNTDPGCEFSFGAARSPAVGYGGEHGNCTIHEVLLFSGPLSDGDLVAVHGHLSRKWAAVP